MKSEFNQVTVLRKLLEVKEFKVDLNDENGIRFDGVLENGKELTITIGSKILQVLIHHDGFETVYESYEVLYESLTDIYVFSIKDKSVLTNLKIKTDVCTYDFKVAEPEEEVEDDNK